MAALEKREVTIRGGGSRGSDLVSMIPDLVSNSDTLVSICDYSVSIDIW